MHLIHHHMMSVAPVHCCWTQTEKRGDFIASYVNGPMVGKTTNISLVSLVKFSASTDNVIRSVTNQKMIPCLLVTKELLIFLTWTQYKLHWYISLLINFFSFLSEITQQNSYEFKNILIKLMIKSFLFIHSPIEALDYNFVVFFIWGMGIRLGECRLWRGWVMHG